MKRILIQNNFSSLEHISSLKDLLNLDINNDEIELDFAFCLNKIKDRTSSYNLIISHPHLEDDCCLPVIKKALEENVKVVFLYKFKKPHGEAIEAIAKQFNLDVVYRGLSERETYYNAIKKYLF